MKLLKFFIAVLFWGSYFIPIYSFEKTFRRLSVNANNFYGIYHNGIMLFSFLAIVFTLLFLWLSPKFFDKAAYKAGIILLYITFYYFACTSIAWDYRIFFGTTWRWSEIFSELVKPRWYFYVFGILGTFYNYQFQKIIQKK